MSYSVRFIHIPSKPIQITRADMVYGAVKPGQETSYAPHGLTYAVRKETETTVSLCQKFAADGILVCDSDRIIPGNVSFTLTFESGKLSSYLFKN